MLSLKWSLGLVSVDLSPFPSWLSERHVLQPLPAFLSGADAPLSLLLSVGLCWGFSPSALQRCSFLSSLWPHFNALSLYFSHSLHSIYTLFLHFWVLLESSSHTFFGIYPSIHLSSPSFTGFLPFMAPFGLLSDVLFLWCQRNSLTPSFWMELWLYDSIWAVTDSTTISYCKWVIAVGPITCRIYAFIGKAAQTAMEGGC